MIDERSSAPRRLTRTEQRAATRVAIVNAAAASLAQDGYAAFTTRHVAEKAGVAQSTVMHHFETREVLLVEAVSQLVTELAESTLDTVNLGALRSPEGRGRVLDQAWEMFTSPTALAAVQVWAAAWTEPELVEPLHDLEERLLAIAHIAAGTLFPEFADDPEFGALIDATLALVRGLVIALPISGQAALDERWAAIQPIILRAAGEMLDRPPHE